MKPIPLTVKNPGSRFVKSMPLRCGVPLPIGSQREVTRLVVRNNDNAIESQLTPLALWPDGSLRWVLIECLLEVEPNGRVDLWLHAEPSPRASGSVSHPDRSSAIDRQAAIHPEMSSDEQPIPFISFDGNVSNAVLSADIDVVGSGDHTLTLEKNGEPIVVDGKLRSTTVYSRSIVNDRGTSVLGLEIVVDAYPSISQIKISLTLHNRRAALHTDGFWDLGDKRSVYLKELAMVFRGLEDSSLSWHTGDHDWHQAGHAMLKISQLTSGGETKHSPNHINAHQAIPNTQEGFTVELGKQVVERGNRISPCIEMVSQDATWALSMDSFWQNFPKVIHRDAGSLRVGLLPCDFPDLFEIQGGEKKTHTLYVGKTGENLNWVGSGISSHIALDSIKLAEVLPYCDCDVPDVAMDALIEQGISGPNNFFKKRELIDEYGWRNFGDVHADHETLLLEKPGLFSSHYNNQYDLVYGFLRMYLLSAKPEWFQLGRDLAEHVIDIDIYHTDEDRVEYNGGLFWHTDHYHPALTSSHRSYSRHHDRPVGQQGGGGPGGEHCYTTGLKLYYLLTGNEHARSAVLGLSNWVTHFYDGGGTLCEEIFRLARSRFTIVYRVARGDSISRHLYPIHRGIGNLIVAQLDAFELTSERSHLDKVEAVILGAIGPRDNLEDRGLRDIEENWFYSIFLQALIRYLDVKRLMAEFDASFFYARDSLLHYADWIVSEETPYLEKPEVLQYPNHTWTAQDIRRCAILLDAYRYADTECTAYLERAKFFAKYVVNELKSEPTSSFTRILAILMQNHGASALALTIPQRHILPAAVPYSANLQTPHTIRSALSHDAVRLLAAIRQFSFQAEWKWLRLRFS